MSKKWDLAVLGGGPGGYTAAMRAAQFNKRVILVEKDKIGGTCMNYGCIPTKYLLHQAKTYEEFKGNKNWQGPLEKIQCNWKKIQLEKRKVVERLVHGIEFLLEKKGVTLLEGNGFLKDEKHIVVKVKGKKEEVVEADNIILATGSRPAHLSFLIPDGKKIITSRQALELESIPQKMVIIGAGAIGLEMGTIYQKLGTEVIILEIMPTILPGAEKEIITRLERLLKRQGLKIFTQMKIENASRKDGTVLLKGTCLRDKSPFAFGAEKVLVAVGRMPNSTNLYGKEIPVFQDKKGFVKVNSHLETGAPGVYAIGDIIGGKLYAHKATHEGFLAVENVLGKKKTMNYDALPMAVYTEPEFSSVGLTEQEARGRGKSIQVGFFSLQANGRALTIGKQEGMVKIIADQKDRIVGAHILAAQASELVAEMTLAISKGLRLQDISSSVHVHPTLSEAVMEAALKARGEAIHALNI